VASQSRAWQAVGDQQRVDARGIQQIGRPLEKLAVGSCNNYAACAGAEQRATCACEGGAGGNHVINQQYGGIAHLATDGKRSLHLPRPASLVEHCKAGWPMACRFDRLAPQLRALDTARVR